VPRPDPFILHIPPVVFYAAHTALWKSGSLALGAGIIAATTLLFLLLAVYHLPRRAFAPRAHLARRFFAWLDRGSQRVNRLFGNVVLSPGRSALPGDMPILWREQRSRLMSRPAHLARLLLAVEVPVLLLTRYLGSSSENFTYDREQIGLSIFAASFGTFSVLALSVTAANAFAAERVSQTLEVLLTTPLAAREIVRQKARALRGLLLVFAVPLLTIFGYEAALEYAGQRGSVRADSDPVSVYVVCVILTVAIYFPLVTWLALWIGLATRTRLRAIAIATCVTVGWCALPYLVLGGMLNVSVPSAGSWLYFASPLTVPGANEMSGLGEYSPSSAWLPMLVNFTLYGIVLHAIRSHCLTHADDYLRR
jgi:ABC-type transport system involved in multi-copper enzyme maturation permease subunit